MRRFLQFFLDVKIRTSLVLVLAIFFLMLLAGAGLGLGSLHLNNNALGEVVHNQQARASVMNTISGYKDIQITLGRAYASQMVSNNLRQNQAAAMEWDSESGWAPRSDINTGLRVSGTALSEESKNLLLDARGKYAVTMGMLNDFRTFASDVHDPSGLYRGVDDDLTDLMIDGIEPLIALLEAGNVNEYQTFLDYTTLSLEKNLISAVELLVANQQSVINDIHQNEIEHYRLLLILVGSAITVALIIGVLSYVFLGLTVLRPLRRASQHFDRIANGDLTQRIDVNSRNEIGQLYAAMRRMQDGLTRVVSEVRAGVEEITVGSTQIYRGNTDLSSRTEQQAASLQQTAASMEQLDSTVRQNTENAIQADNLAKGASDVAQRGGVAVTAVVETMKDISTSSGQMSEIVSVIDGIAFQTNILALNAAVEAARAGEQGRGFAVVAGEVRSLAQRSAQAAREIKQLIDESVLKVEQGAGRADEAGQVMHEVVSAIQRVTTIMAEISSASHEQSDGIGQVNLAVTEMDSVVQQNAALVEQAANAAGSLQAQATRLSDAVAFFRLGTQEIIDVDAQEQQKLQGDPGPEQDPDDTQEHNLSPAAGV